MNLTLGFASCAVTVPLSTWFAVSSALPGYTLPVQIKKLISFNTLVIFAHSDTVAMNLALPPEVFPCVDVSETYEWTNTRTIYKYQYANSRLDLFLLLVH